MNRPLSPGARRLNVLGAIAVVAIGGLALSDARDSAADSATGRGAPRPAATGAPASDSGRAQVLAPMTTRLPPIDQLRGSVSARAPTDVFAGRSWQPPAPPTAAPLPQAAPPPTAPGAPPLPYVYLGKWAEQGKSTVFYLERGPKLLAVRAGDRLDEQYQLDGHDGADLVFTYLPLQTRQTIRIGE